jgi:acyl carrier protein
LNRIDDLREFVVEELLLGTLDVAADDDLLTSGLVDSLGIIRLIGFIEESFQVSIPPEDVVLENFLNLNVIDQYLSRRGG